MSKESVEQIYEYFANGMTPGTAYREFVNKLKLSYDNTTEYQKAKADRSICPRRTDFNFLYVEYNRQKFGGSEVAMVMHILEDRVAAIRESRPDIKLNLSHSTDSPLLLSIVTPLMQRVHHHVRESREIIFIDSSSNMDEYNLRVFLVVTQSIIGALPLGLLITSDERTETLIKGFELLKCSFTEDSFYGNGPDGPFIAMTDNCAELRDALTQVFPSTRLLLCTFHILQQVWRWINDVKHGIHVDDKRYLLQLFKNALYAPTENEFFIAFKTAIENSFKYYNYQQYMRQLYVTKYSWALCYRSTEMIRGSNTNNYVESQSNVIKDGIIKRCKEYNINGLLEKLLCDFDQHFEEKLLSVASGSFDGVYSRRFSGEKKKKGELGFCIPESSTMKDYFIDKMFPLGNNVFIVPSLSNPTMYIVDMNSGVCSCESGKDGSPCKHQYLLWANKLCDSKNFLPYFNKEERMQYAIIATGTALPVDFYEGLHDRVIDAVPGNKIQTLPEQIAETSSQSNLEQLVASSSISVEDEDEISYSDVQSKLKTAFEYLSSVVSKDSEKSLITGVVKFAEKVSNIPLSRLPSALHNFGNDFNLKRKGRNKISVQPESVKRRKSEINGKKSSGSRQKQFSGRKSTLKKNIPKKRRGHKFSQNVRDNIAVPNKAQSIMSSKTKTFQCKTDDVTQS